jgi:hypothetical protein
MEIQRFDKFEYCYKTFSGFSVSKIIDEFNKLGQDGWELINEMKDNIGRNIYVFKRRLICNKV